MHSPIVEYVPFPDRYIIDTIRICLDGIRQKECNTNKKCVPLFDKKCTALLWFASGFVWEAYFGTFCRTRRDFCQRVAYSQEKRCNPWKSVKVRRTQTDKRGARYTTLISGRICWILFDVRIPYIFYEMNEWTK